MTDSDLENNTSGFLSGAKDTETDQTITTQSNDWDVDLIGKLQTMTTDGVPLDTLRQALGSKYNANDTNYYLKQAMQPKIDAMLANGVEQSTIDEALKAKGITYTEPAQVVGTETMLDSLPLVEGAEADYGVTTNTPPEDFIDPDAKYLPTIGIEGKSPEEIIEQFNTITQLHERDFKEMLGGLAPKQWKRDAKALRQTANLVIEEQLSKRGVKVVNVSDFGDITFLNPETGEEELYDPSWYEEIGDALGNNFFEMSGALTGASTAMRAAAPTGNPWVIGAAGLAGGALGGAGGAGADMIISAKQMQYKLGVAELTDKMGDAAVLDVLTTFGVSSLAKLGSGTLSAIASSYSRVRDNNTRGAFKIFQEKTTLNTASINELMGRWSKNTGEELLSEKGKLGNYSNKDKNNIMKAAGMEMPELRPELVAALPHSNSGGVELLKQISKQSGELTTEMTDKLNTNIASFVQQDLNTYLAKTGDEYRAVRDAGVKALPSADTSMTAQLVGGARPKPFTFSVHNLPNLVKSLELSGKKVDNPFLAVPFSAKVAEIKEMGAGVRSFEDLLNLKEAVNALGKESKFSKFADQKLINNTRSIITKEISRASKLMPDGEKWLRDWKKKNIEYGKREGIKETSIATALAKPNVNPADVISAFKESLGAIDNSVFLRVAAKLPAKTRDGVQDAVMADLLTKYTAGKGGQFSSIDFQGLDLELGKLAFTSRKAKETKQIVAELATNFQNSQNLANILWDAPAGKHKGNIATSLSGKAAQQIASVGFKILQTLTPGRHGDKLALTLKMKNVLDNPLKIKSLEELKKAIPDKDLQDLVSSYSIELAKKGAKENYAVKAYKVGNGKARYLTKSEAQRVATLTGGKVSKEELVRSTLAGDSVVGDAVFRIYGRALKKEDYKDKRVIDYLKLSYKGMAQGGKVTMF